jgi:UDP-2-acetamido-3-amino-2,3-dideoxy-glucuronate N-acetyltransferase
MRILLIGLGGFGKNHLRVWRELGQEVLACDANPGALALCDTYGIPADHRSRTLAPLLERADAVDIVTPTDSHFGLAQQCLAARKDVFIEKPVTLRSEEALELKALAERTQQIVQVGHIFRFNPAAQYLKTAIQGGTIGRLRYLQGFFKGFKRMRTDVGVTQTDSIHFIDLFNWFVGALPQAVTAVTRDHFDRGLDDVSHLLLEYERGPLAHIEAGYFDPETVRRVTLIGEAGCLRSDIVAQQVELFHHRHVRKGAAVSAAPGAVELPRLTTKEPLEQELRNFLECVQQRRRPLAGLEEGYATLRVVEAAYESSRTGRRVPITSAAEAAALA